MCGLGREAPLDSQVESRPTSIGDFLRDILERRQQEQADLAQPDLANPQAPHGGTLLRPTQPTATRIGAAPGVTRRRFRARTLGIQQLGVPLPGQIQGGLDLPDFE